MTRTIEIEQFVDLEDIDIRYFDRPYMLVPGNKGEKGYVLLREAIKDAGKAGIAKVVIRARQYLAALDRPGQRPGTGIAPFRPGVDRYRASSICRPATCASTASRKRRSSWPRS